MPEQDANEPETDGSDGVAAGVEQFQKAALDALAAARAMIDAAESVVREPGAVESLVATISDLARTGTRTVSRIVAEAGNAAGGTSNPRRSADVPDVEGDGGRVAEDDPEPDDGGGFEPINLR